MTTQATGEESTERVDFAREILPILSDKCFVCHGPDQQEGTDLRLDSLAAATADRGGYRAVDPDAPEESELLARIHSEDDPMPPSDAEKRLTEPERQLLSKWIRQGGNYAVHWSLVPPTKSADYRSAIEAIDELIAKPLRSRGIEPAPQAERSTLARRVALILTGLPPEPEQLDAFLADETPEAYERLVDQLLQSPRFGEHQARYWLDAVRYGDTHGLHLDNRRGIYPYRDWVVRALNANLPMDDFIRWQIAGDLLPDATLDQQLATGFIRLNPSTGEGGAIPAEFQVKNNFDRVETLGTVFLGLTLTCARCHTHKYDPIEQTEYYRLLAFFNSTAEPSMDGNSYTYGPVLRVPADDSAWQRWRQLNDRASELMSQVDTTAKLDKDAALAYANRCADWEMKEWQASEPISVDNSESGLVVSQTRKWSAIDGLPGSLSGRNAKKWLPGEQQVTWVTVQVTVAEHQSLHVLFVGAAGSRLHLDQSETPTIKNVDQETATTGIIELTPGKHELGFAILGSVRQDSLRIELSNPWAPLASKKDWEACSTPDKLRMIADRRGPILNNPNDPNQSALAASAMELADALTLEESKFTTSLIAQELPQPRQTHLLRRGEYDLPVGEPLEPGTPKVLGAWPADAPTNRVGLANWLTSRDHPLVARVLVNRIWQRVFGHALARTPEDFGLQGQQPTHPELLDWLAMDLHDSQWNFKAMIRAMVLSRTFRQSSKWRSDLDDPENRWFARASSYRFDAEVLRDVGLWAGGLLDPHMGGEGVKPYQPDGMWAALAHPASNTKQYQRDQGERLYRRSLYVYWKRTSPHPMMTLFDAPDRESSCVRRSRTNTPLQSLGMLNETQRIEIGRGLATRLLRAPASDVDRIDRMFRLLACRGADRDEIAACQSLLDGLRDRYKKSPDDAKSVLQVGDAPNDPNLDPTDLAAWSLLATTVLASDLGILMY